MSLTISTMSWLWPKPRCKRFLGATRSIAQRGICRWLHLPTTSYKIDVHGRISLCRLSAPLGRYLVHRISPRIWPIAISTTCSSNIQPPSICPLQASCLWDANSSWNVDVAVTAGGTQHCRGRSTRSSMFRLGDAQNSSMLRIAQVNVDSVTQSGRSVNVSSSVVDCSPGPTGSVNVTLSPKRTPSAPRNT